jgi:hypothetical protein
MCVICSNVLVLPVCRSVADAELVRNEGAAAQRYTTLNKLPGSSSLISRVLGASVAATCGAPKITDGLSNLAHLK